MIHAEISIYLTAHIVTVFVHYSAILGFQRSICILFEHFRDLYSNPIDQVIMVSCGRLR